MKNILSTFILLLSLSFSFGQKEYDYLRILYADGSYEKLAKQAEKITLDDKTKKDPLPYLWLSKALYKIHMSGTADEVFKNAYKESINALGKCIKYDKSGSVFGDEDNKEYLEMIQSTLIEQINNEMLTQNFRKASSWSNTFKKIAQSPIGSMYFEGAAKFRTDDRSSGMALWKTADGLLKDVTSIDTWTKGDKDMLRIGVIQTAECYVSIKKVDLAKNLLNKVAQWFENDTAFKEAYDAIVN
ncbi:MAG TPA: hypothetical protein PKN22_09100 [Taishania sp.]|nr:hypothetical protein [Taishania sp.]HNS42903.1 hypothetical protein [Taishania sp.]